MLVMAVWIWCLGIFYKKVCEKPLIPFLSFSKASKPFCTPSYFFCVWPPYYTSMTPEIKVFFCPIRRLYPLYNIFEPKQYFCQYLFHIYNFLQKDLRPATKIRNFRRLPLAIKNVLSSLFNRIAHMYTSQWTYILILHLQL